MRYTACPGRYAVVSLVAYPPAKRNSFSEAKGGGKIYCRNDPMKYDLKVVTQMQTVKTSRCTVFMFMDYVSAIAICNIITINKYLHSEAKRAAAQGLSGEWLAGKLVGKEETERGKRGRPSLGTAATESSSVCSRDPPLPPKKRNKTRDI